MRPRWGRLRRCCGSSRCRPAPNSPSSSATQTASPPRRTPPSRRRRSRSIGARARAAPGRRSRFRSQTHCTCCRDRASRAPRRSPFSTTRATMPVAAQMASAHHYVSQLAHATGRPAALTGAVPGQFAQGLLIDHDLNLIELITLALIVLVVAVSYRSLAAPLIPLAAIAVAFPITLVGLHQLSTRYGIYVPQELDPIVIALMLGIITDYSIFFLSGVRQRRMAGEDRRTSVRSTAAEYTPIILTSGLILSCGLLGLLVSGLGFFRHLGPALALTVAIALVVSLTLLPALLAVVGRFAYWPNAISDEPGPAVAPPAPVRAQPARLSDDEPADRRADRRRVHRHACCRCRPVAQPEARLRPDQRPAASRPRPGAPPTRRPRASLRASWLRPRSSSSPRASVPGSCTAGSRHSNPRWGTSRAWPGVLGPREQPTPPRFGVFLAPGGNAARIVVLFRDDPLGAAGIHDLQTLQRSMPKLAGAAGLGSRPDQLCRRHRARGRDGDRNPQRHRARLGGGARGEPAAPDPVLARHPRPHLSPALERRGRGGRPRHHDLGVPDRPRIPPARLLRAVCRIRPPGLAGLRLQRVRGRQDLAGGARAPAARRRRGGRPQRGPHDPQPPASPWLRASR